MPQDYTQAATWYRKAAEQGNADAQFRLGVRYANGQGIPQDYVAAYALANVARANGNAKAQEFIDFVTKKLTKASVAQAQSLSTKMAQEGALLRELDKFMAIRKK